MKTLFMFLFLLAVVCTTETMAQKNRAYALDCFSLMELLQKDYTLVDDPVLKDEMVIQDRKRLLLVFKNYLNENYTFTPAPLALPGGDYILKSKALADAHNNLKNNIALLNSTSSNTYFNADYLIADQNTQIDLKNRHVNTNRENIAKLEYELFLLDLTSLTNYYSTNGNLYLVDALNEFKKKYVAIYNTQPDVYASSSGSGNVQKSFSLFTGGALTLTEAIDGLAQFIAGRLKEELATQAFDKIQKEITSSQYDELKIVLPNTFEFLRTMKADEYASLINTLKSHIKGDLSQLLVNLPKLQSFPAIATRLRTSPELRLIFMGLDLIGQLKGAESPLEMLFIIEGSPVIKEWASLPAVNVDLYNVANALKLSALIARGLVIEEGGQVNMISLEAWKVGAKNIHFYKLFLGLLLQQNELYYSVNFYQTSGTNEKLKDLLLAYRTTVNFAITVRQIGFEIENFLIEARSVGSQIREIKKLKNANIKIGKDTVVAFLNSSVDLLEKSMLLNEKILSELRPVVTINYQVYFSQYLKYSRDAIKIYSSIQDKAYIEALTIALQDIYPHTGGSLSPAVSKTLEFLVSTSKAEDADQFEAVIEQYVLPSGSSSIKRKSNFNLALNTYPGFLVSREKLMDVPEGYEGKLWATNIAFAVPIGLAASWGLKKEGSLSLFASVIDIGAFTSVRLNDTASALPEINFKNIFAPGGYLIYGFPRTPFSVGGGIQYGPTLRSIAYDESGTPQKVDVSSFRVGILLAFDIPLLNLFTHNE